MKHGDFVVMEDGTAGVLHFDGPFVFVILGVLDGTPYAATMGDPDLVLPGLRLAECPDPVAWAERVRDYETAQLRQRTEHSGKADITVERVKAKMASLPPEEAARMKAEMPQDIAGFFAWLAKWGVVEA